MEIGDTGRVAQIGGRHRDRLVQRVGRLPSHACCDFRLLASSRDYPSDVLASRFAPVPHVERMYAVVGVAVAVHVNVGRVARELGLEVALQFGGLGGLAQAAMEELDVARMMLGMELVAQRMTD